MSSSPNGPEPNVFNNFVGWKSGRFSSQTDGEWVELRWLIFRTRAKQTVRLQRADGRSHPGPNRLTGAEGRHHLHLFITPNRLWILYHNQHCSVDTWTTCLDASSHTSRYHPGDYIMLKIRMYIMKYFWRWHMHPEINLMKLSVWKPDPSVTSRCEEFRMWRSRLESNGTTDWIFISQME